MLFTESVIPTAPKVAPKDYVLTPEHEALLKPWAEKWMKNALNTAPYTEEERKRGVEVIRELYRAADLTPPREDAVIYAQSPIAAVFGCGAATFRFFYETVMVDEKERVSEDEAVTRAIADAKEAMALISAELRAVSDGPVLKKDKWFTPISVKKFHDRFGADALTCANKAYRFVNGGSFWSGSSAYVSFFRCVANLDLDFSKWIWYERATEYCSRWMHKNFCIIIDRPVTFSVDEEMRPHSDNGPFGVWADGCKLYAVHSVRVHQWFMENPGLITATDIENEENAEIRRIMLDKFGRTRFLKEGGAVLVDESKFGKLWRKEVRGDEPICMVEVINSTPEPDGSFKTYMLGVPPEMKTAREAVAWTVEMDEKDYAPEAES